MHVKYIWFKVPVRGKQRIKSDIIPFISTLYLHNGMDTFFEHPIGWKTEDTYTHNKISNSTILKQTYIQKYIGLVKYRASIKPVTKCTVFEKNSYSNFTFYMCIKVIIFLITSNIHFNFLWTERAFRIVTKIKDF